MKAFVLQGTVSDLRSPLPNINAIFYLATMRGLPVFAVLFGAAFIYTKFPVIRCEKNSMFKFAISILIYDFHTVARYL